MTQSTVFFRLYFVAFDGCKPRHNIFHVTRLTLIHSADNSHCYTSEVMFRSVKNSQSILLDLSDALNIFIIAPCDSASSIVYIQVRGRREVIFDYIAFDDAAVCLKVIKLDQQS